jgi:pyrroloquinoline quinone biosynthesis protein B
MRQNPPAVWLIDATPDIKYQLNLLRDILGFQPGRSERLRQPDGVFLTHGHMGHTLGLAHLGPEGMAVQRLTVYAHSGLARTLMETRLWAPLLERLSLVALEPNVPLELAPRLIVTPIPVPHRDELAAGTFAYRVEGEAKSLLYLPDIDSWTLWPEARAVLSNVDIALVDASFYDADELGGREAVAHPLVTQTLEFFQDLPVGVLLTHMNHTNPLLQQDSAERQFVRSRKVDIANTGQVITL